MDSKSVRKDSQAIIDRILYYASNAECLMGLKANVSIKGDLLILESPQAYLEYVIVPDLEGFTLHASVTSSYSNGNHYNALDGIPLFYSITIRRTNNLREIANKLWLNAFPDYL